MVKKTTSTHRKRIITSSINLFKGRNRSFIDRFIKWALSIGRLIIITTELIALSAFLYRFSLDRNLIDLQDRIKSQQKIVEFLKPNELRYRNLQDRLTLSNKLITSASNTFNTVKVFIDSIPSDMVFNTVSYTNKVLSMSGNVQSITSLKAFIATLRQDPQVKFTRLDHLENKISNSTILFNITVTYK